MRTQLLTAAFFMEGLHEAKPGGYDALITAWDKGCIEMIDAMVSYVPFTVQLCEAALKAGDGMYPGVFDYEVSGPFGKWFGEYILQHGDEPLQAEAKTWLTKEVTAFFSQGLAEDGAKAIREVVYGIPGQ